MQKLFFLVSLFLTLLSFAQDIDKDVKQQYYYIYNTPETNNSISRYGDFSLRAYHANYYLPVSYSSKDHISYEAFEKYRQIESQIQFSIRFDLFYNLFGFNEIFSLAYTQKAFWQNYTTSSPFRETNYNPEAFFLFPLNGKNIRALQIGYAHQSNGQGLSYNDDGTISEQENRSRTWNYLYSTLHILKDNLSIEFTLWARILKFKEDATADLYDYMGYGNVKLRYSLNQHDINLLLRYNPLTGYGAVEGSYSYPMWFRNGMFWYVKLFSGYGESLIDYNNHTDTVSLGISFSR